MFNHVAIPDTEHVEYVERPSLPVGGMPMNSPSWVPENVFSVATMSPSAIWSLMSTEKSGNACHR